MALHDIFRYLSHLPERYCLLFPVQTKLEEFGNSTLTGQFGFVFFGFYDHVFIVMSSFPKTLPFSGKLFSVRTKTQRRSFSNFSGLKSVFEKLRFRDG